jgi:hypothetical protein
MRTWFLPALAVITPCLLSATGARAAACDWPTAKADIVLVLDGDKAKVESFHALTARGRDPLTAVESLVDEAARGRIRDCAYESADYLTQRGYPPFH